MNSRLSDKIHLFGTYICQSQGHVNSTSIFCALSRCKEAKIKYNWSKGLEGEKGQKEQRVDVFKIVVCF